MAITIHQRVALFLWHWKTGPGWVRSPSSELKALRAEGARVLKVQMQDDGPLDPDLVKMWRSLGYKLWPMMWGTGDMGARETADWFKSEKDRMVRAGTNFDGVDFNFEDPIRTLDLNTNGSWSEAFAKRFRELCPTLPAHLDTYFGSAAGGMNLGAYVIPGRNFRMAIQSFWGPPAEGLYDDPIWRMVAWCKNAQPSIPKAQVKPIVRVSPKDDGSLPNYMEILDDCVRQGTKGLQLYYIDGAPSVTMLRELIREAVKRGVAYK